MPGLQSGSVKGKGDDMSVDDWSDLRVFQIPKGIMEADSDGISYNGASARRADPEGILNWLSDEGLCDWVSVERESDDG